MWAVAKKSNIVEVSFFDHCMSSGVGSDPLPCKVYGVLIQETKDFVKIASWLVADAVDENTEVFTIIKQKGTKIKILR